MASQYDLPYTGPQVETLLAKISELESEMPSKTSDLTNDSGFITSSDVPTKTSDLNNDSGFITNAPVAAEAARAQAAEALLATISSLQAEISRATGVEGTLQDLIDGIAAKIPSAATEQNQLADKAFVNSSIATASATFRGTYISLVALQAVAADENDYGYVISTDAVGNTIYNRYKYANSTWTFEYAIANPIFDSSQWAAINSAITAELVEKLRALPTNAALTELLNGKQGVIADLDTIRANAALGGTAYQKPAGGIPKTDLASGVQTSLNKADSALQQHQDISGKADKTELEALAGEVRQLGQDESSLRVETMGYEYEGAFNITSSGEHSSTKDRIVFDSIIPAGNYKISLLTGTTGNRGYATIYVKYIGQSGTTSIGSITIGATANFVFADSVESIGMYMTAAVNQHAGMMPLLIVSTESLNQRLSKLEDLDLENVAQQVISNPLSVSGKNLVSGRNAVLRISLIGGTTYHTVVDVSGAVSRAGNLFPGWYNGNTGTLITVPDSAKPTISSSVSHIEFDYTPEQDYPNGLFGISNYSYNASNIQSVNVTITNVSLGMRLDDVEQAIEEISDGSTGETIFSFNPDVEVEQKLSQLVMPFSLSGAPVADSVVSFLHFSDIHAQNVNLERIMAFANKYADYLHDVISSGDQIAVQIGNSFDFWNACGAQKVLLTIGNHETWQNNGPNDESDPASAADCYAKYFGNIAQWGVTSPGINKCYYYKDYNPGGSYPLRLIVIDCMHIDSDQTAWFEGLLSEAKTNGYTVVIMSHYSPSVLAKVDFDEDSTFTCVDGPRNWTGYDTVAPLEILVDSYITAGGKFACWLCGHLHWDMFGLSEHGQPIVCIECATTVRTDRYDARVIGTKTQDSFNIVSFDTYKGIFRIARIGNDMDRYLRPKETMCYDYVNKVGIFNA